MRHLMLALALPLFVACTGDRKAESEGDAELNLPSADEAAAHEAAAKEAAAAISEENADATLDNLESSISNDKQ